MSGGCGERSERRVQRDQHEQHEQPDQRRGGRGVLGGEHSTDHETKSAERRVVKSAAARCKEPFVGGEPWCS